MEKSAEELTELMEKSAEMTAAARAAAAEAMGQTAESARASVWPSR